MSLKTRRTFRGFTARLAVSFIGLAAASGNSEQKSDEQLIAVGWVQAAGEIRIYPHKRDLGKLYDGTCISGVMSEGRTMPTKFTNQRVSVYGTLVDAKEFSEMTLRGISSGVENYCNSPKIAIITRMVANTARDPDSD